MRFEGVGSVERFSRFAHPFVYSRDDNVVNYFPGVGKGSIPVLVHTFCNKFVHRSFLYIPNPRLQGFCLCEKTYGRVTAHLHQTCKQDEN